MIIFRYIAREILTTLFAVTFVLLLVSMSFRFIKYLAQAASGVLAPDALLQIMAWRLPGFLELIMPLGLFLGILFGYGRMCLDSEMTVLRACGMRTPRLVGMTLAIAAIVAMIIGCFTLYVTPKGNRQVKLIFNEQDTLNVFDLLQAGRFQRFGNSGRFVFTESISEDKSGMTNVFISEQDKDSGRYTITVANAGRQEKNADTGSQYVILEDGYRFDGQPAFHDYRITNFGEFGFRIIRPEMKTDVLEAKAMPTMQLLEQEGPAYMGEFQWRLSVPVSVLIVALLAIPLSHVNPRQGRFYKMVPALLLYIGYVGGLIVARKWIEDEKLIPEIGMWPVHLLFLGVALTLITWDPIQRQLHEKRLQKIGIPNAIAKRFQK